MIQNVEVKMWGTTIGYLHMDGNKPYAAYEYDENFIKEEYLPKLEILTNCLKKGVFPW